MKRLIIILILACIQFSCSDSSTIEFCSPEKTTCIDAQASRLNPLEPYQIRLNFFSSESRYEKEQASFELLLEKGLEESMSIEWLSENSALIEFKLKNGQLSKYRLDHLENKFHYRAI